MTILLLILKILGILVLSILGLLLLLALLLLFVPISYRVWGDYHETACVRVCVRWLFGLFTFRLQKDQEKNLSYLRIFGIRKNLTAEDNCEDFTDTNVIKEDTPVDEEPPPAAEPIQPDSKPEGDAGSAKKKTGRSDKVKRRLQEFKQKPAQLKQKVCGIKTAWNRIMRLIRDEGNQTAVRFLFGKLFFLLKKIMPRRLRLRVEFSTGSPDTTGLALGVFAMFPIGYRNRWDVIPDFTAEKFYIEADFDVKGRLFIYHFAGTLLTVLLDKNCRGLFKQIRSLQP